MQGVETMTVTIDYFLDSERGSDTFRFAVREDAQAKFLSLRAQVMAQLPPATDDLELVDEPDFYGFLDRSTGKYVRVFTME